MFHVVVALAGFSFPAGGDNKVEEQNKGPGAYLRFEKSTRRIFSSYEVNISKGLELIHLEALSAVQGCLCTGTTAVLAEPPASSDCPLHHETFWLQHFETNNDLHKRASELAVLIGYNI